MKQTATRTSDIPKLGRDEAMALAKAETERFVDLLRSLDDADWRKPTDCDRWNVQEIVSHLVSMNEAFSSFRTLAKQQKAGKPFAAEQGLTKFDGWTEYQAKTYGSIPSAEIVERYVSTYPTALKRRASRPAPLRMVRLPSPPYGWFSFAYLLDDILTRDVWMHRVDISRATGRDLVLTPEHDGRFVANIVRDLGNRWDRPFTLHLTGPAGGTYVHGEGGQEYTVDAVEFCRILSGRSEGHGLPTDVVPF